MTTQTDTGRDHLADERFVVEILTAIGDDLVHPTGDVDDLGRPLFAFDLTDDDPYPNDAFTIDDLVAKGFVDFDRHLDPYLMAAGVRRIELSEPAP